MKKPEGPTEHRISPSPGVGDPASQDDNTTLTDAKSSITIVKGPNDNQGGN